MRKVLSTLRVTTKSTHMASSVETIHVYEGLCEVACLTSRSRRAHCAALWFVGNGWSSHTSLHDAFLYFCALLEKYDKI